jgi:hypothetical protein
MQDVCLPKKIFFGELKSGKRSRGGQKKRFKDTHKTSLKSFNVDVENWETLVQDRETCGVSLMMVLLHQNQIKSRLQNQKH